MTGPYECFACGKQTKGVRDFALTVCLEDDNGGRVQVGPDCYRKTVKAGTIGYQPQKGGPRLYMDEQTRNAALTS